MTRNVFLQKLISLTVGSFTKKFKLIKATVNVTRSVDYFYVPNRIVWNEWKDFLK